MQVILTGPKTCPPRIGGIEVFTFELGKKLAEKGIGTTIVAARMPGEKLHEQVDGVDVRRVKAMRTRLCLKPSMLPGIHRLIEKAKPDVIHANDGMTSFYTTFAFREMKTLVTVHGIGFTKSDWPTPFRQFIRLYQLASVRNATMVTTTDETTASVLRETRDDVEVVPSGVNIGMFEEAWRTRSRKQKRGRVRVLYVGRLIKGKGFDLFMNSLEHLDKELAGNAEFVVVGNGPLARLISEKGGSSPSVRWLGELPHASMPKCFAQADLLVSPSRSEGLPMALLEAMAAGVPIVCSEVGGVKSYFDDTRITPIESLTSEGVARAIEEALKEEERTQERAQKARRLIEERFSWDRTAEQYIEIYKKLVS
jgi:glycosyltransferase involved in cell wall biosynthesis